MTFRVRPTNHACGMVVQAPRYRERSQKAENKKKLCKKSRLNYGFRKVKRNGNPQLELVRALRFQIIKTMRNT